MGRFSQASAPLPLRLTIGTRPLLSLSHGLSRPKSACCPLSETYRVGSILLTALSLPPRQGGNAASDFGTRIPHGPCRPTARLPSSNHKQTNGRLPTRRDDTYTAGQVKRTAEELKLPHILCSNAFAACCDQGELLKELPNCTWEDFERLRGELSGMFEIVSSNFTWSNARRSGVSSCRMNSRKWASLGRRIACISPVRQRQHGTVRATSPSIAVPGACCLRSQRLPSIRLRPTVRTERSR